MMNYGKNELLKDDPITVLFENLDREVRHKKEFERRMSQYTRSFYPSIILHHINTNPTLKILTPKTTIDQLQREDRYESKNRFCY